MSTWPADESGAGSDRAENRETAEVSASRPSTTRRRALATAGSALAGSALVGTTGVVGAASAQEETTTDGPTTDDPGDEDAAQKVTTTMAIEDVPEFEGPYGSQFVVIQSTEYSPERTPGLEDCSGVNWTLQNTKSYDGAIIDRVSQNPDGFRTTIHIAAEDREFRPGQTFVISDATECGDYVALGVEGVGPLSLAGKEAVGTVTEADGGGGGSGGGGPTPGFTAGGAMAALAALLGVGARWHANDDE